MSSMKIEVAVRITEKQGYDWREVAVAKVEDSAPWPIRAALEGITEDVAERIARQLKAESKRIEALAEAEVEA